MSAENIGLYEQIVSSFTSGVIVVESDATVLYCNPAAFLHLNVTEAELALGSSLRAVAALVHFIEVLEEMRESLNAVSRREITVEHPDGKRIVGLTASLLRGPSPFNGVIFLFVDLTEVRGLERAAELNRQLAQIGELTAGVVHELRNPLSVISGMAEIMERKLAADPSIARHAQTIMQEVAELEKLISHFLSFAKPFQLDIKPFPLAALIERSTELCARAAAQKRIAINADNRGASLIVEGDLNKLSQAVSNIIGNAVEILSPGGAVNVITFLQEDEAVIRIEDTGPGIHLEPGDNLFSPFFTRKEGGTGLGLSIAHRVVSAHYGILRYGNREGAGAFFEMWIPLKRIKLTPKNTQ